MPPETDPAQPTVTDGRSQSAESTVGSKPNLIGKKLGGRYLIEHELARGGMGVVYLATDKPEMLSRRVVIKVLLEDALKDEWVVKKFNQEIESLTRLNDPGVVGIFDAGTLDDGSPYLVMEYVEGTNLRAAIKPEGMEFERAANIIRQIGKTLTAAHEQGIVHRDLKPENIMLRLTKLGEEQVKVIDFGIAKVKNSAIAPTTLTGLNVAGTIMYMSPEQLSAKSIGAASDIYALALICYEMLAGRRPFNPETQFQLSEMQKEGVQVSPTALRPALPENASNIILKALSYNTAARPQRAKDFADDVARALDWVVQGNTEEERSTVIRNGGKEGKAKPAIPVRMMAAAALILAGVIGGVVWLRSGSVKQQAVNSNSSALSSAEEAPRKLTYWLTIQQTDGANNVGAEYPSTGQNQTFGNAWRFRLNIRPEQSGSVYMLSEFAGVDGAVNYNVLFPTPENNGGVAQLAARSEKQTGFNHFPHDTNATEKVWVIWSRDPLEKLDSIFKDAASHNLIISDPSQAAAVQNVLRLYTSARPLTETDDIDKRITLKGNSDTLVNLLELKHEKK